MCVRACAFVCIFRFSARNCEIVCVCGVDVGIQEGNMGGGFSVSAVE